MSSTSIALAVAIVFLLSGCGARSHSRGDSDGGSGADSGGVLSDAGVPASVDAGPRDSGSTAPPDIFASGPGELLELFVVEAGIVLVLRDRVSLIARDGAELLRWDAPREITAAALDGARIGVADLGGVTALDLGLSATSTTSLTETCASAVIVGGGRFVCGPDNDRERVFYTYDLDAGIEIARSAPLTANGIPMRRVPGVDAFITLTGRVAAADFDLYRVDPSGAVVYINESPSRVAYPSADVYAFDGEPPTHLVTPDGLLLRFDECMMGSASAGTCFYRDGTVGTLVSDERFVAMDLGADGMLYTIQHESRFGAVCTYGCSVQRIDIATHTVTSEAALTATMAGSPAFRQDPWARRVVVGSHAMCGFGVVPRCSDWSVRVVAYE